MAICALIVAALAAAPVSATPLCPSCNVVLVLLSGVRRDSVESGRMPGLARAAERSVLLETAISPSGWPLPSIATALTGQPPSRHGLARAVEVSPDEYLPVRLSLSSGTPTLASLLRDVGYRTALFLDHNDVPEWSELERGFDDVRRLNENGHSRRRGVSKRSDTATPFLEALAWARERPGGPFLLTVVSDGAHNLRPRPRAAGIAREWSLLQVFAYTGTLFGFSDDEAREVRREHDRLLRDVDEQLEALTSGLASVLPSSRTVVMVASTNGFALGEHEDFSHGVSLYDELVRVPWLVSVPGLPSRTVREQVTLLDLLPTVLDLIGVDAAASSSGRSLTGLLRGEDWVASDAVSETKFISQMEMASLRTPDGWKLIRDHASGRRRLFRLSDDSGEKLDLAALQPRKVEELGRRLDKALGRRPKL